MPLLELRKKTFFYFINSHNTLNSSFRLFEVDPESFYIKNMIQYRLDLEKANKTPDIKPKYEKIYDFNSFYGTQNLYEYSKIKSELEKIKTDKNQYLKYLEAYYTGSPQVEEFKDSNKIRLSLFCKAYTSNFWEFVKCSKFQSGKHKYFIFLAEPGTNVAAFLFNILTGSWYEKAPDKVDYNSFK